MAKSKYANRYAGTAKPENQRSPEYYRNHAEYNKKARERKRRANNNAARSYALKKGLVKKGEGKTKQVNHIKPLHSGGSNAPSNLEVISTKENARKREKQKKK